MKKLLLFLVTAFLLTCSGYAQNVPDWNLEYSFKTADGAYMAICSDGNHFYASRWLSAHIAQHNMDGSAPDVFTITGVKEICSITYDGTYFYGVNSSNKIYKMDFANRTLISTVTVTCSGVTDMEHITYDPTLNGGSGGFWVGGWNEMGAVSMSGAQLIASVPGRVTGVSGAAYDPYTDPANPCLWLLTEIQNTQATIRQFDINTLSLTSVSHNCNADHPDCAGRAGGGVTTYLHDGKFWLAADIQTSPNTILIFEMADLLNADAPASVANLTITPDPSGALNAIVNWTNPNETYGGTTLTELTAVKIYNDTDNTLIYTVLNPTIGGTDAYTVTVPVVGKHSFKLVPENSHGEGPPTRITSSWIGHDIPSVPVNPILAIEDIIENVSWTIHLSWSAPATGLNGGYFTAANLVYDVFRMPGTVLVSENQAEVTFTETITEPGTYFYKIVAKNHIGTSGSSSSSGQMLCWRITAFPFVEPFSTLVSPPVCWMQYQAQGTLAWKVSSSKSFSPPYSAQVWGYDPGVHDTWLITPEITLPASGSFILEFQSMVDFADYYGSSEVWISTQSNQPASGDFVMVKQLVKGVDFGSTANWRQLTVVLDEYSGENIYIGFRYYGANAHAWFIDDVTIRDLPDVEAIAKKLYGALLPMAGEPFLFKAAIENKGSLPLTNYTVTLIDGNDNILAVNNSPLTIPRGETAWIPLYWTPENEGVISLYAIVEATGDADISNNKTPVFEVTVQPADDVFESKIGAGTTQQQVLPFNFMMAYSMTQTIFFDHEIIGRAGSITQLQYFSNFIPNFALYEQPIQIWMANTTQNTLNEWMPESEFLLVFEGLVDFPGGSSTTTITLDVPFTYTGNNLVIMSNPIGMVSAAPGRPFYATETPEFQNRSRIYMDNWFAFDWTQPGAPSSVYANIVLKIAALEEEMGSVSGMVTSDGTTPVEGALVEIIGTTQERTTDANGAYSFNYLEPGTYQFKASKYGYSDATSGVITVNANENSVVDFIIAPTPTYTISGKVIGSNAPGGLENVAIHLTGYQEYTTTTNAAGDYSITDIYDGHTYNITATLDGYQLYTSSIQINGGNVVHNITLNENSIDNNNPENIILYPNPFTNEIYVSHPERVKNVQITDIIGQTVKQLIFNGNSIVTENLSSGIYFVKIETLSGKILIQKMVKN